MNLNTIAALFDSPSTDQTPLTGICIDSRQVKPGNLFVALRGERFDGHDFMEEAVAKGAVAVLCNQANPKISVPQLEVPDTLEALARIASYHRQSITCPIIALTGSNGKTTVKEMIASVLPKPAHATPGNLNNHIGVPLTLLQLKPEHRYAVFELGANHPGEIAHTVAMVKPQVALINNIAPAHIEGFGSIDGVARTKGEIYQGLAVNGTAVINADDDYAHFWDDLLTDKKVLRFSLTKPVDVYARDLSFNQQGCASFTLVLPSGQAPLTVKIPGEHTVRNALAAAACCYAAGISLTDIVQGLSQFNGVAGRMTFLSGKNDSLVIDDTYNANLRSVLTAVDVLSKRQGRRILVLGDMGELGAWTQKHHEEIGHVAQRQGIDLLMTCGVHSEHTAKAFGSTARHYNNQEELAQDLLTKLDANTTVLVKGSRSSAMEKIVRQLVG
ncbi:UDP-N-acetylmuramoyl-tripeptide--D-alanyl-D-alanine ligase [Legionella feeleii]|uniref:UDP-N-acetylmuramoyl-tripeptide--D-alanyl-D-alanine ligase n=1 Tax=Legionella feeleii TaxID=453 RepID=A0A0W0U5P3_9GAMM|nr:UDP-N-acetylmuramoyl-tripeptide--D-alanyl-D-alanine ligase [Legionella feeleii]KTD02972.1 UDP-N-acetylmuramoyl-tripeptide--D-alanyl-D- alani ne ligase [Legionella feeleii]SPX62382.1 UDP-N-acetylmuramoyl-tripeptide--D-alanyl-D-alanine ligase [Legionella feeleii]